MTSLFLLLHPQAETTFDIDKVRLCLKNLPGVRNWREGTQFAPLWCEFDFKNDSTILELQKDLNAVVISGSGDASLEIALQLYRCYGAEIYAIDDNFMCQVQMSTASGLEDFRKKLEGE